MDVLQDASYMKLALQMAEQTLGQTGINPVVGCVIVKEGRIIGMGSHLQRGAPHAEIHALQTANGDAEGSTVYVSLEPCGHYGKTPPCSDRLISEKVARVVIACQDPNPKVAGQGIRKLRDSGIEVEVGLLEQEAVMLNENYNKYIISGLPFVTLKTASTLDGKIATVTGDSKWITNEQSRAFSHTLRHQHQAIMVGVNTVMADDPSLSSRLTVPSVQPIRIVVDSKLRTPINAKLLQSKESPVWILTTDQAPRDKIRYFQSIGVEIIHCGPGPQVDLRLAMKLIGEREVCSILQEGGGRLNGSMLEAQLIDKAYMFFAPKIIGGGQSPSSFLFGGIPLMKDAIALKSTQVKAFGEDICIYGYPEYGSGES